MKKIILTTGIVLVFLSCKENRRLAIENELDLIEHQIYFYPETAGGKLDSFIYSISPDTEKKIETKISFLSALLEYEKSNIDSALFLLDKTILKSISINDVNTEAKCQMVIGWIAESNGFFEQAKISLYNTIDLLENTPNKETGWAYLGIARCKKNLNEPFHSDLKKGVKILKDIGKIELVLYAELVDYALNRGGKKDISNLKRISKKYLKLNLYRNAVASYKTIAHIYKKRKLYDSAHYYIDKAIKYNTLPYTELSLLPALFQLKGSIYFAQKDYDSTKTYMLKAIRLYNKYNKIGKLYYAYVYLYRIDKANSDYKSALNNLILTNKYYKKMIQQEKQQLAAISESSSKIYQLNNSHFCFCNALYINT